MKLSGQGLERARPVGRELTRSYLGGQVRRASDRTKDGRRSHTHVNVQRDGSRELEQQRGTKRRWLWRKRTAMQAMSGNNAIHSNTPVCRNDTAPSPRGWLSVEHAFTQRITRPDFRCSSVRSQPTPRVSLVLEFARCSTLSRRGGTGTTIVSQHVALLKAEVHCYSQYLK